MWPSVWSGTSLLKENYNDYSPILKSADVYRRCNHGPLGIHNYLQTMARYQALNDFITAGTMLVPTACTFFPGSNCVHARRTTVELPSNWDSSLLDLLLHLVVRRHVIYSLPLEPWRLQISGPATNIHTFASAPLSMPKPSLSGNLEMGRPPRRSKYVSLVPLYAWFSL